MSRTRSSSSRRVSGPSPSTTTSRKVISTLWLYQTVDVVQGVAGFTAFLAKVGESISFLSFLDKLTPKADKTQAIDLGLKVVSEIACFCQINGLPGDSVGDFVESLADYKHEALIAWPRWSASTA